MSEKIEIDIVRNLKDLLQAFDLRREEFVKKQNVPEEMEFDGNDFSATQIIAKANGKPIATMRVRYFHDFVKFERMCVIPAYRKQNIPQKVMEFTAEVLKDKGFKRAMFFCRPELVKYWKSHGCQPVDSMPGTDIGAMKLCPMSWSFTKKEDKLQIKTPAAFFLAEEGKWNRGGR